MISLPETETLCSVPKIAWLNAGKELGLEITLMCWTVEKAGLCFCKVVGVLVGECWSSFLSQSSFSNAVLSKSPSLCFKPLLRAGTVSQIIGKAGNWLPENFLLLNKATCIQNNSSLMFVAKGYNMSPFVQLHACCLELSGLGLALGLGAC